jgi:hypothetical protein
MHQPPRNTRQDAPGHTRRKFLKQSVATGATVAAAAALPVMAQENAERPRAGNGAPDRRGSVAETLADFAVRLRYEDLPGDVVRTPFSIRSAARSEATRRAQVGSPSNWRPE